MKLLSDPFQVDPTGAAVKYQMELTDIQNFMIVTWRELLMGKICWALAPVMFHQTVTPIYHRMPRISLLCLVAPTILLRATCSQQWKTQKRNQGLCLQMNIWQHHCVFWLLLLEQIQTTYANKNNARFHTTLNWSALTYNLFCIKRYCKKSYFVFYWFW